MSVSVRNKNSKEKQDEIDQRILEGIRSQLIPKSTKIDSAYDEVFSLYTKDASKFGSIDWKSLDKKIKQQGYESKPYSYRRFYQVIVPKRKQSFSEAKQKEHDLLLENKIKELKITPDQSEIQIETIRLQLKREIVAVIYEYNSNNNNIYNCQREIFRINHQINTEFDKILNSIQEDYLRRLFKKIIQETSDDIFKGWPLESFDQTW
ncbi:Hypothetical_protein [Hexamita inflata]|uniref:Hypothetical_protein n=1 Tax=Hexamita inflata TaxID=28002 RepID=A0AA86RCN9_9EUKA|nr:Hypothetical protein HINF_LOCUS57654 [Hexamita inflata]